MNRLTPILDFMRGMAFSRMLAWFLFINGTLAISCLLFGPDTVATGIAAVWESAPSLLISTGGLTP